MENYERVGKLVSETYRDARGVGSRQIEIFRCLICRCLVDSESLAAHRDICQEVTT